MLDAGGCMLLGFIACLFICLLNSVDLSFLCGIVFMIVFVSVMVFGLFNYVSVDCVIACFAYGLALVQFSGDGCWVYCLRLCCFWAVILVMLVCVRLLVLFVLRGLLCRIFLLFWCCVEFPAVYWLIVVCLIVDTLLAAFDLDTCG